MSVVKKIISNTFETVKETAAGGVKQIGETLSPGSLLEQALGTKKGNEFTEYLKNTGDPNMTMEDYYRKESEAANQEEKEKAKYRAMLKSVPDHMRPAPKQKEPTPYEKAMQEAEQKKAKEAEAAKSKQPIAAPTGKQRGMLGKKVKQAQSMEGLKKDSKSG